MEAARGVEAPLLSRGLVGSRAESRGSRGLLEEVVAAPRVSARLRRLARRASSARRAAVASAVRVQEMVGLVGSTGGLATEGEGSVGSTRPLAWE